MKPLELDIWVRDADTRNVYYNERTGLSDLADEDKHLTPSECAAEYWRNESDTWEAHEFGSYGMLHESWPNESSDCVARAEVLARFATLPHASERNYE